MPARIPDAPAQPLRLILNGQPIDLEQACPRCAGKGFSMIDRGNTVQPCDYCRGGGQVVSHNGLAILRLVQRYKAHQGAAMIVDPKA
jgi:hypothetical protein